MPELIFIFLFLAWYILSLAVSENLRQDLRPGTEWSFFLCMVFSPLVGYLLTRIISSSQKSE
jgi:hypothetical protein